MKRHDKNIVYNSILVVVDKFTKMVRYLPVQDTMSSKQFAQLMFREIFSLHQVPEVIISDQGSLFTSVFWATLTVLLGADHRLSTAFHPETDRQTERQNATLEHYLRCFLNYQQDNWPELLPLAQYIYNTTTHSITKVSPLFTYTGRDPTPYQLHPSPKQASLSATEMAAEIIKMQSELQLHLCEAQDT